jgi:DNA-binding transcriptional MocR family regulator
VPDLHPLELTPDSSVPLYKQLADAIGRKIRGGVILTGDRLPPTRELADRLGLNRTTVSAAYSLLERSGLLEGHVGRGSFVAYRPVSPADEAPDWEALLPPIESSVMGTTAPQNGSTISFANSRPPEASFPLAAFRRLSKQVIDSPEAADILQLGSPYGYEPLRQHLLAEAKQSGLAHAGDDLLVTNGCQQALDLLTRTLIAPEGTVFMEEPVYGGLLRVLTGARARTVPVPVGPGGIALESLERLSPREGFRMLIVTPNFQNPTGQTLSLDARKRLLEIAAGHRMAVVESNVYGDLRYRGEALPSLKQLPFGAHVIYLGSYSKVAFPGLRVGWIIGPRPTIARLAAARQTSDIHGDQLSQAVLLRFAQSGELARHLVETRREGGERLDAVLAACERWLPEGSRFTRPEGGMNLWVELPHSLEAETLLNVVAERGLTFLPGTYFSSRQAHRNALRLSFGGLPPGAIREGVKILGEAAAELLARPLDNARPEPAAALV